VLNKRYLVLVAAIVAFAPAGFSAPPQISSDEPMVFDSDTQSMKAVGEATLVHDRFLLIADEIEYFRAENRAQATGNVRLMSGGFRLVSDSLNYNAATRHVTSETFRAGDPPLLMEGSGFSGSPDQIDFADAVVYFHEPGPLALNYRARNVSLYPNDRVDVEGATFRIGRVPIFYLPKYSQKIGQSPYSFSGDLGFRSNLGGYAETRTLFRFNEVFKAGLQFNAYTERGFLAGPTFEWRHGEEERFLNSTFLSGYINDQGGIDDLGKDVLRQPIDKNRYFIEWRHQQDIRDNLSLTASISAWSDSEVERDFQDDYFRDNQKPDSFVEAVYTGKNTFISAFARIDPNDFQVVQERLPEVRIDRMPVALFDTGIYHSFSAGAARLQEEPPGNIIKRQSDRLDAHYSIYKPIRITSWLNVMPVASVRVTHYDDTPGARGDFTRIMGEVGFDAQMVAHRIWEYQNKIWKIDGLRHVLRPVLRYRYLPGAKQGNSSIIPIDDDAFTTSVPAMDLGNIRHIDELTDRNMFRLGIENVLQTREAEYGSRNLMTLNLYQDIFLSGQPAGQEPGQEWADFYSQFILHPVHWLSFEVYKRFDTEQLTLKETRTRLMLSDGDVQTLAFSTSALQHAIDQYILEYHRKLNESWRFYADVVFDARLGDVTEQRYSLRQRWGNRWDVEYQISVNNGSTREDNVNFKVRFHLLRM